MSGSWPHHKFPKFRRPLHKKYFLLTDVHWSTICSFSGWIGFVTSLIVMWFFGDLCLPDSILDRLCIIVIGCLSFAGQICMVYTVKFESAGSTALIRKSFDVTLAFIFQIIFFHVSLHPNVNTNHETCFTT